METTEGIVSQSFVYMVSARAGNNFWARLLNGCDKVSTTDVDTMSVGIGKGGRFVLFYNPDFAAKISPNMLRLVLVHEAGHIALRHHERFFRILAQLGNEPDLKAAVTAIFNLAADYADNDAVVRHEEGFDQAVAKNEWTGLLPETAEPALPKNRSFEDYALMLTPLAQQMLEMLEKLADEMMAKSESGGQGEESDDAGESGSPSPGSGSTSKPGKGGQQAGPATFSDDPDDTVTEDMHKLAEKKELVEALKKAFERLTQGSHNKWLKDAQDMSPEEAMATANRLKQHARKLARSAWEQTVKSRGFIPGHIEGIIKPLLKDDQVPWDYYLADIIESQISSKIIEAMAQPNLSLLNEGSMEPWPGYALDSEFNVIWVTDTSGSMSDTNFARACAIFNSLMDRDKRIRARHIHVDAALQYEGEVDNIQPPEPSEAQNRHGYGGTVYTAAFKRILGMDEPGDWVDSAPRCETPPPKPNLVIFYTDGCVGSNVEDVLPLYRPQCPILWLIAPKCTPAPGMSNSSPDFVLQMYDVNNEED